MFEEIGDGWFKATIRTADEAWELLRIATSGGDVPERLKLEFDGWPTFEMRVGGKDWKSTVPTRVMGPLLELQKDLHRNYVAVSYGTANLRKLRDEDRDALEIVVKVADGSSDFTANLAKQFNALAEKALEKMEARHAVITILGIAAIWGGVEVNKDWVAARQKEVDNETKVELSKQETARLNIMKEAAKAQPLLSEVRKDHEQSANRLLKSLKPSDMADFKGVELSGLEAMEITQTERARSEDIAMSGGFRVMANDASKGNGFRIKVARVEDGLSFFAEVPFELPTDQKNLIQQAEWSKGALAVHLEIEAFMLRGAIHDARVLAARSMKTPPD